MNKTNKLSIILCLIGITYILFPIMPVHGESMCPTSKTSDCVLTATLFATIKRGDIVIIRENGSYCKRVIGLPGETIEMVNGQIYIDGELYIEDEFAPINGDTSGYIAQTDIKAVTLADDEYFVMGDNRAVSCDSRTWIRQGIHIRRNNITQKVIGYLGQTLSMFGLS